MKSSDDTERSVEVCYAACNDCDWYELTGEDEVYANNLAYEHQEIHQHESYDDSQELVL